MTEAFYHNFLADITPCHMPMIVTNKVSRRDQFVRPQN